MVGAGPAGSLLAGLLARTGVDVILLGPHESRPPTPLQSLAPAALGLLADERVDVAGTVIEVPIEVRWPASAMAPSPAGTSILVDRASFDSALRGWAAVQGVRMLDARLLQAPTVVSGEGVLLDAGEVQVGSRHVINAAGARSVFAARRRRVGAPLFGLVTDVATGDWSGVRVEAIDEGWMWMASAGDGRLSVLTTHASAPPRRDARAAMCHILERATSNCARAAAAAVHDEPIRPMDLSASLAEPIADVPAVGDAAVCVDPIAGQGLALALRSAAQMADHLGRGTPLVRTSAEVSAVHSNLAHGYYAKAARHFGSAFWTTRT